MQSYIVIQRIRFDETLDYRLAVEADELKDVLIPKLTLQPLIENAIRYGLEQSTQICRVQLSVRRQGAQLVLLVQNDGSLYEDDLLEKLRQKTVTPHGYGIGLLNIEKGWNSPLEKKRDWSFTTKTEWPRRALRYLAV